jgi:Domain of unknown function (DUF4340)
MKFKSSLILLGVAVVMLVAVLYFDAAGKKKKAAEEKTQELISLTAADVHKLSLVRNGETLTLERDGAGPWRLTAPLQAAADETEANSAVDALASLRLERVVEKEAKDPAAYEIPKTEVSLWVKGREAPVRLLVGMENPLDRTLFAKRSDDPRIVLLPSTLKTTLDKTVFDFRQKDVFKFTAAEVREVRGETKAGSWRAARDDAGWMLKQPVVARAAKGPLDALLDSLSALRAKAFVAESKSPESLKDFGLDKPDYEVALSLPAENREVVFALHKKGESLYATTSQSTKIITFEGTLLADLDRKVEDLRDKKVAEFYSWEADRIALKRDGVEISAVKEKAGDTEKWVLEGGTKTEADRAKVEDFLRKIESLEAAAFIDAPGPPAAYGLEPGAELRIRTKDAQNKEREIVLLVGREDAAKKLVPVKVPGLAYLFQVDPGFLQDWPKGPKDWTVEPPKTEASAADKKK